MCSGYKLRETDNRLNRTKLRQTSQKTDFSIERDVENGSNSRSSSTGSEDKMSIVTPLTIKELRQKGLTKYDAELLLAAQGSKFTDIEHGVSSCTRRGLEKLSSTANSKDCAPAALPQARASIERQMRDRGGRFMRKDEKTPHVNLAKHQKPMRRMQNKTVPQNHNSSVTTTDDEDDVSLSSLINRNIAVSSDELQSNVSSCSNNSSTCSSNSSISVNSSNYSLQSENEISNSAGRKTENVFKTCIESNSSEGEVSLTQGITLRNHKRLNEPIDTSDVIKDRVNYTNTPKTIHQSETSCVSNQLQKSNGELHDKISHSKNCLVNVGENKAECVIDPDDKESLEDMNSNHSNLKIPNPVQEKKYNPECLVGNHCFSTKTELKIVSSTRRESSKNIKNEQHYSQRQMDRTLELSVKTSVSVTGVRKESTNEAHVDPCPKPSAPITTNPIKNDHSSPPENVPLNLSDYNCERTKDIYEFDDKEESDLDEPRLLRRSRLLGNSVNTSGTTIATVKPKLNGCWNLQQELPHAKVLLHPIDIPVRSECANQENLLSKPSILSSQQTTPVKQSEPGRVKLTLRMKRSPVLDEVIESGSNFSEIGFAPEYEVLRVEGVENENVASDTHRTGSHRKKRHKSKDRERKHRKLKELMSRRTFEDIREDCEFKKTFYSSSNLEPVICPPTKRLRLIFGNESRTIDIPSTATAAPSSKSA